MKARTVMRIALESMKYANIRTMLTIIAIIIGMFSLTLLTGVSKGLEKEINNNMKMLGDDMITIAPFQGNILTTSRTARFRAITERFSEKDVEKIKSVSGVERVFPTLFGDIAVEYKGEKNNVLVYAVPFDIRDVVRSINIEEGRWIRTNNEVVLGSSIKKEVLEADVGKTIKIKNKTYRVVGVLEETGNNLAQVDNVVFLSYDEGRKLFKETYGEDEIAAIIVKVAKGFDANKVGKSIDEYIMNYKHLNEDNKFYTVVTPEFINSQVSEITSILNLFFIAVSAISLIIGIVGVGNTMYMNVIDRYRDIAVMKAVGAKRKEILFMFLFEGVVLGAAGGIVGIMLGIILGLLSNTVGIPYEVDIGITGIGFTAVLLGSILSSYLPADIGASINAAEAMRYE